MNAEFESDSLQINRNASAQPGDPGSVTAAALRASILVKLASHLAKRRQDATERDWLMATAAVIRDIAAERWLASIDASYRQGAKRVYYLSLEFLIGRLLFDNLNNLGLTGAARAALASLDVDLDRLRECETEAALGNGGLGRLAACFIESMATLDIPASGYGIRYEHGLFRQAIRDGWQQEYPENWLTLGNPWEFERPDVRYKVGFGGTVTPNPSIEAVGNRLAWQPAEVVEALAYDTPVVGWRGRRVNTLRLWAARALDPLRLDAFNRGDYASALAEQVRAQAISKLLYPSDATPAGRELRLRQEYFFVAASLQDLVRRHLKRFGSIESLPEKTAIQLNDTHPAIAVAELMRILVDLQGLAWRPAWRMVQAIFGYTNHTLLPEAQESWPVELMERLLPRHMQIIFLINALHLDGVRKGHPGDDQMLARVSLISERPSRRVRMGHLAFLASHRVNGVSALHTELLRKAAFPDLAALRPDRIINITNGIAFRRWLHETNPRLTSLLAEVLGPDVLDHEEILARLVPLSADAAFRQRFAFVRMQNKRTLADLIRRELGIHVDPTALFDAQIKRIHEYKRQLLNILASIAAYQEILASPSECRIQRVKILAGKAAASYQTAKLIIKLAHDVARVINSDPTAAPWLRLLFLPNYSVSLAEKIVPASDLSEQIATAGMEASGTGNMKLALNGALTIGTLDGANVEIRERVGAENMFIFGLDAEQVAARRRDGLDSEALIAASPELGRVLDALESGQFSPDEPARYRGLVENLRHHDYFMVCADFDAYRAAQRAVAEVWAEPAAWWRAAVLNTASMSWFSADRAIRKYAAEIWDVPVAIASRAAEPAAA